MFQAFLSYTSAGLCGALAAIVLIRGPRALDYQAFVAGMVVLAMEAVFRGLSIQAGTHTDVMYWQQWQLIATALLPGSWLLFSLSFARANYREHLVTWRWAVVSAFVLPPVLVLFFARSLFVDAPMWEASSRWVLGLGWSGYAFFLFFLLSSVLILMNLERTLRASSGSVRWQIKFMILGLGSVFVLRMYTSSQTLLFTSVTRTLEEINAGTFVGANVLILVFLMRSRMVPTTVYLSQTALYNSLTVLIVGLYLVAVGALAEAVSHLGDGRTLSVEAFFVFLALLGLVIVLLSDEVRQRGKLFLSRHLQRPRYDYREAWTTFTQRTMSLLDRRDLCTTVAKIVSETFGVACVSLWLWDEHQGHLSLGGSTVFSEARARALKITGRDTANFVQFIQAQPLPTLCNGEDASRGLRFTPAASDMLREARIHCSVALVARGEFVGMMTLDERITNEPFSAEDIDLLKTLADQTASSLLNLGLSQQLVKIKEMEAFHILSAFFLHDLKNLAATLSLTMQNLPAHYDDPEFRNDALRIIANCVGDINTLCSRLSLLTKKLELQRTQVDLNELITTTLANLNGAVQAQLIRDLQPVPRLRLDPEQLQKVLINLILNANEAVGPQGEIHVTTTCKNGWGVLSVSDNGCGMSPEFMERSLFRLFQTTKSRGLGIGLYHSKAIVEAHQGRIEVESEEGKGSTFRVLLPV